MRAIVGRCSQLTAVFAFNELMAIGGLAALRRAGRRGREDVCLVGFDDFQPASAMVPALTHVSPPAQQLGTVSVRLLLERILNPAKAPSRVVLPTELVIRESCRPVGSEADVEKSLQPAAGAAT